MGSGAEVGKDGEVGLEEMYPGEEEAGSVARRGEARRRPRCTKGAQSA